VASKRRTKAASKAADAAGPGLEAPAVADASVAAAEAVATEPVRVAAAEPADPATVRLPGALQIRSVDGVATSLRAALGAGALRLDGGEVTQVDTAGVQVLVAAIASARRDGAKHEWLAASPALRDAARRLGVAALLELPASAG
jgi:anti-anti-sigma regulatory factor